MATLARHQFTAVDQAGNILPGATVEVRNEATAALASLFSDRAGATPIGNPFTADAVTAFAAFHVVGGAYKITVTSGAFSITWRYVAIGTAAEFDSGGSTANFRTPLLADATVYVSPSGSDSTGDGTIGNPWKTPQFAANYAIALYDFKSRTVTVQLADGTYPDTCSLTQDNVGGGSLVFNGNAASPGNVIFTGLISVALLKSLKIQNMDVRNILADSFSQVQLGNGLIFGQTAGTHLFAKSLGLISAATTAYRISGGAVFHWRANNATIVVQGVTITLDVNSPLIAFSTFCDAENTGLCLVNLNTFLPSPIDSPVVATGARYLAQLNGVVQSGATTFPGNAAGSTLSGGQYA